MPISTTPGDRVYAQYRNKPKAVLWQNILQTLVDDNLTVALSDLSASYDIDANAGEQLNIIGRVVVQDRIAEFPVVMTGIVECGDLDDEFGDLDAEFSALTFLDSTSLTDDEYKGMLKSKIQRNNTAATIDEIMTAVNTVLSSAQVVSLNDNGDMTFDLDIIGVLTATEISLLASANFVPRPQCVMYAGYNIINTITGSVAATLGDMTSAAEGTITAVPKSWVIQGTWPGSQMLGTSIDSSNDDVWILATSGDVYKLTAGIGTYNTVGTYTDFDPRRIAVNSSNQDVWITDGSGFGPFINKLTGGVGSYVNQGTYPGASPTDIAINPVTGDVWIVDDIDNDIYKLTAGVGTYDVIGVYPGTSPSGIAVDPVTGDVYVIDGPFGTASVYKLTAGVGTYDVIGVYPQTQPHHIAYANDVLYIFDSFTSDVITLASGAIPYVVIPVTSNAELTGGIAADSLGDIWVTDGDFLEVLKYT